MCDGAKAPLMYENSNLCYGNYLEGKLNYVVYGDLTVSISQEKQNNLKATPRLFLQFMWVKSKEEKRE